MSKIDNETPLVHVCNNRTRFTAERADLNNGVIYTEPTGATSQAEISADFFEFGAWHAAQIWPELNGFQGYDCVQFTESNEPEPERIIGEAERRGLSDFG